MKEFIPTSHHSSAQDRMNLAHRFLFGAFDPFDTNAPVFDSEDGTKVEKRASWPTANYFPAGFNGLASRTRVSEMCGRKNNELGIHLISLPDKARTLESIRRHSMNDCVNISDVEEGDFNFVADRPNIAFASDEIAQEYYTKAEQYKGMAISAATRIIGIWETSANRGNAPYALIDDYFAVADGAVRIGQEDIWRAAINSVVGVVGASKDLLEKSETMKGKSSAVECLIYNFGPDFALKWLNGSIISNYVDNELGFGIIPQLEQLISEVSAPEEISALKKLKDERQLWIDTFSRSTRLYIAAGNPSDPMEAVRRVKKHLDETLSDGNLAEALAMNEQEIQENFPRSIRLYFAVCNTANPIKGVQDYVAGKITYKSQYFIKK